MKHASNKPAPADDADLPLVGGEHAETARQIWLGSIGRTVRCVPERRTVMASSAGTTLYGKLHLGSRAKAVAEWRWLHLLPMLGVTAARPVAFLSGRRRCLVVTERLAGRSLDAWAVDAAREGWLPEWFDYVSREVAALVRKLHGQGLIHRDLNTAHLFVGDPRLDGPPGVLDVERMFRPRWRFRRWVVKDLASLLASVPVNVPVRVGLRFLRAYSGQPLSGQRPLMLAIARKVERIRRHQPRFG